MARKGVARYRHDRLNAGHPASHDLEPTPCHSPFRRFDAADADFGRSLGVRRACKWNRAGP